MQFSIWKRAIFRKVKEIKHLSGGVVLYAAQSNAQTDAEIAEKGRFQTKTNYILIACPHMIVKVIAIKHKAGLHLDDMEKSI